MQPIEKLSRERPLGNILNFYVLLSILIQFAIHIAALLYMTVLAKSLETFVPSPPTYRFSPLSSLTCLSSFDLDIKPGEVR